MSLYIHSCIHDSLQWTRKSQQLYPVHEQMLNHDVCTEVGVTYILKSRFTSKLRSKIRHKHTSSIVVLNVDVDSSGILLCMDDTMCLNPCSAQDRTVPRPQTSTSQDTRIIISTCKHPGNCLVEKPLLGSVSPGGKLLYIKYFRNCRK